MMMKQEQEGVRSPRTHIRVIGSDLILCERLTRCGVEMVDGGLERALARAKAWKMVVPCRRGNSNNICYGLWAITVDE